MCQEDVSYLVPALEMRRWWRIRVLMSMLVLVAVIAATVGASYKIVTEEGQGKRTTRSRTAKASGSPRVASATPRPAGRTPGVTARGTSPGASRAQAPGPGDVAVSAQEGEVPPGFETPVYRQGGPRDDRPAAPGNAVPPPPAPAGGAARPVPDAPPPPVSGPVAVPPGSASRPPEAPRSGGTGSEGVIIGITAIDYYPLSCTVWGFAYNDNPHMVDIISPNVQARDDQNMLCQASLYQSGAQDWTIQSGDALFFWPAFSFPRSTSAGVPGYDHSDHQPRTRLSTVSIQIAGLPGCTLTAQEKMTNQGHFDSLPRDTRERILRSLRNMRGFRWWEKPNG